MENVLTIKRNSQKFLLRTQERYNLSHQVMAWSFRLKLRHGMFSICAKHIGECGCGRDAVDVFCLLPFSKKMRSHTISCVRGRGEHMMHFPSSNQSWLRKCGQIA